jgi:hypothetical protein
LGVQALNIDDPKIRNNDKAPQRALLFMELRVFVVCVARRFRPCPTVLQNYKKYKQL